MLGSTLSVRPVGAAQGSVRQPAVPQHVVAVGQINAANEYWTDADHAKIAPRPVVRVAPMAPATTPEIAQVKGRERRTESLVHFGFNSVVLDPASAETLKRFVGRPEYVRYALVAGYADAIGGLEANLNLSKARANHVRNLLISYGVPSSRIDVVARGEDDPLDDNQTVDGRARNRRVLVELLSSTVPAAPVSAPEVERPAKVQAAPVNRIGKGIFPVLEDASNERKLRAPQ